MNTQATSFNCIQLKQSANWCSFFFHSEWLEKKQFKKYCQSHFQKNKWTEYAKIKKIKKKKKNEIKKKKKDKKIQKK